MSDITKYNRTVWVNDQTKLNAKNMNNIEVGIETLNNETANQFSNVKDEIRLLSETSGLKKLTLNGMSGELDLETWGYLKQHPENYVLYLTTKNICLYFSKDKTQTETNVILLYTYSDVKELKEYILTLINGEWHIEIIENTLPNKVDKIEGKGLSTNDFSDEYKKELDNLPNKLNKNLVTNIDTNVSGDNININITYTNLNNDNEQTVTKILSPATIENPGLMSSENFNTLNELKSKVEKLEGKTTRLLYTNSTNPTKEDINTFVIGLGYSAPFEGIAVVINQTYHIWHYYSNNNIGWKDDGQDTVSAFTNDVAGIIKGSGEVEGKVYAESDGTGSVYGWDTLTSKIDDHINNTNNPHNVTKAQIGLNNVDNTSDLNKPISTQTKEYVDNLVGDINTILDTINGEVI